MSCQHHHHCEPKKIDYLLWASLILLALGYGFYLFFGTQAGIEPHVLTYSKTVFEFMNKMWIGLVAGFFAVGILAHVPREMVMAVLGPGNRFSGILRAAFAGTLLDLCSHGILMVGAKLYDRGASNGQVMAFLITSPWNSFSLTLIMLTLIGWQWVLAFIALSMAIGIITGLVFDQLSTNGILPKNPHQKSLPADYHLFTEIKAGLKNTDWNTNLMRSIVSSGVNESQMVLRWILFSVVLVGLIRTFVDAGQFEAYFGPTILGLGLTMIAATVIEVCSEGSVPIAADILIRAHAPGNSFAFLMTGISTDYTEIMVLKDTTKSWKIALFLPLITVPQVILVAWLINLFS